jgi:hypothetical protein
MSQVTVPVSVNVPHVDPDLDRHYSPEHFNSLTCVFGCSRLPQDFRKNVYDFQASCKMCMDMYEICVFCLKPVVCATDIQSAHGLVGDELKSQQEEVAQAGIEFDTCGHVMHLACHTKAKQALDQSADAP